MKTINKIKPLILMILFISITWGQGFSNVGSAGANFLKIPVDAAGAALANSNVASVTGVSGLYWNPAAIAFTKGTEFSVSRVNWIADTYLSHIGVAHNIGFGTIGVSLSALTMDDMEITTETNPTGTGEYFTSGSYAAGLSYGLQIIDRFSFGGTVKYIYEYIWDTHGSTVLFDFGSIYQTDFYNLKIGMRLTNFGGNVTFTGEPIDNKDDAIKNSGITYPYDPRLERVSKDYQLPQLFNVGISFDPLHDETHKLTVTAAVNDPNDNNTQLLFGGEYVWDDMLFLRVGYKSNYDEQDISAGFGVKIKTGTLTPQVDFAYSAFGKLGSVMFFGLKMSF